MNHMKSSIKSGSDIANMLSRRSPLSAHMLNKDRQQLT